jgi:hypothetical protein
VGVSLSAGWVRNARDASAPGLGTGLIYERASKKRRRRLRHPRKMSLHQFSTGHPDESGRKTLKFGHCEWCF